MKCRILLPVLLAAALAGCRSFDTGQARALKSADYRARMREGLIPVKDSLEAEAERDAAQVAVVRSRHQEAIARATLELAMGVTALPEGGIE
jgi:outer membrane protein TolC